MPGHKISLQMHYKRAEHWTVVSGVAKVRLVDETKIINVNESIDITIGSKHSLENIGDQILEVIEVQISNYLEEDDIVRFEDNYGRK